MKKKRSLMIFPSISRNTERGKISGRGETGNQLINANNQEY